MAVNKLVLVGASGAGKTTWWKRVLTGDFENLHVPTLGVEVRHVSPQLGYAPIQIDIWDTAGDQRYIGLGDGYWIGGKAFAVFFDVKRLSSFERAHALAKQIRVALPGAPILLVANKVDQASRKVTVDMLKDYERKTGIKAIDMSTKSNHNFDEPIKWAARQMVGPVDDEGVSA